MFVATKSNHHFFLQDWHVFYWLYSWGWKSAIRGDNWGWVLEFTPAFFGAGMLSGMNASWSFMLGAAMAWGLIGPLSVQTGVTHGKVSKIEPLRVRYTGMNDGSPRVFLLWIGVSIMLFYSISELAVSGPAIYRAMRGVVVDLYRKAARKEALEETDEFNDPVPKDKQVQGWAWGGGLLISSAVTILVCSLQFHMNAGNVVLALVLAFIFAFIGVSSSGTTDTNPVGTVAKMSQLVVGGALKAEGKTGASAQLENLLAGSIASSAAGHAVDMLGDLKTGHLVRASPRSQFYAQLFGSVFAVPFSVGMYVVFTKAYPCVVDGALFDEGDCQFGAPAVAAWRYVALAVTTPNAIPFVSGMVAIGMGIFSALVPIFKHFFVPKSKQHFVPNFNAVGLGFVLPQTYYPLAMVIGATGSMIWARRSLRHWDTFCYVLAAGMIVGEGLGGVMNAVLQIAGVSGDVYGSTVALPPW